MCQPERPRNRRCTCVGSATTSASAAGGARGQRGKVGSASSLRLKARRSFVDTFFELAKVVEFCSNHSAHSAMVTRAPASARALAKLAAASARSCATCRREASCWADLAPDKARKSPPTFWGSRRELPEPGRGRRSGRCFQAKLAGDVSLAFLRALSAASMRWRRACAADRLSVQTGLNSSCVAPWATAPADDMPGTPVSGSLRRRLTETLATLSCRPGVAVRPSRPGTHQ